MLPTGPPGKKYIDETTSFLNLWVNNTLYESIAPKTVHVMPALLLQKLSKLRISRNTNKKIVTLRPFESS